MDTEVPTTPGYFTMSIIDYSGYVGVSLYWGTSTDNVGVSGYWIHWCETNLGQSQTCVDKWSSTTSAIYIGSSISAQTTYTCYVTARDEAGNESGQTVSKTVITPVDISPPTAPTQFEVIVDSETQTTLSWAGGFDNYSVYGYKIYRDNMHVATLHSLYPRIWVNTELTAGATYLYEVTTVDWSLEFQPLRG